MTYRELAAARQLFQLGERATRRQIKLRHRQLVKAHHPDHARDREPAIIREINAAYEALMTYVENYRFDFSEREFLEQVPEERLRRQFDWDPVWGGENEPEQN